VSKPIYQNKINLLHLLTVPKKPGARFTAELSSRTNV